MFARLDQMRARYEELERMLASGDTARARLYAKEHGGLSRIVRSYQELLEIQAEIRRTRELARSEDAELARLAEEELSGLQGRLEARTMELQELLLSDELDMDRDVLLEIRAGTGGEEAALFAGDLARMYQKYADSRGWKAEVVDASPSGLSGLREVVLSIRGEGVYGRLRFESGGHRVQRVPATEQAGRIHTSAATVAVLPEAEEVEFQIRSEDLRIDTFRAGGKGGQHVNKTESAVRITHLPTGLVVSIQDERSQHKNRAKALRILRARLFEGQRRRLKEEEDQRRRGLIGSGDRSDRIRTYNFPQNRLTDHRIGFTLHQLDRVMEGHLDPVLDALSECDRRLRLGLPVERGGGGE